MPLIVRPVKIKFCLLFFSRSEILREIRNGSGQQDNLKETTSLDSCLSFDFKVTDTMIIEYLFLNCFTLNKNTNRS